MSSFYFFFYFLALESLGVGIANIESSTSWEKVVVLYIFLDNVSREEFAM